MSSGLQISKFQSSKWWMREKRISEIRRTIVFCLVRSPDFICQKFSRMNSYLKQKWLFLIPGFNSSTLLVLGFRWANKKIFTELIDLSGEKKSCPKIADLKATTRAIPGTFIGGKALICGGYNHRRKFWTRPFDSPNKDCWELNIKASMMVLKHRTNFGGREIWKC